MNNSLPNSNSPNALRTRVSQGLIPRWAPVLLLLARPALALLAQNLALLLFRCLGVTMPAVAVRHWWTVYGSLIDLGCLGLLFWLLRREGLYLRDLIGFDKHKLKTDPGLTRAMHFICSLHFCR